MGACCGRSKELHYVKKVDQRPLLENDTLDSVALVDITSPAPPELEVSFSMVLVGDAKVGKTALLSRFAQDRFVDRYEATIGVEFKSKVLEVATKKAKLQVWDTAGQHRFRAVTKTYFRNANAIFLIFSMTDAASFASIKGYLDEVRQCNNSPDLVLVLVGTKVDDEAERQVYPAEAISFAEANHLKYFEISSKDGRGVDDAFFYATKQLVLMPPALARPASASKGF